jgi:DNA modification methylase
VIELDAHRLVCGDMTDAEVRKALLGRSRADCVWTDPPYAIYGSSSGLAEDITDDKIARPFFQEILAASVSALKLFGHAYICCDWRSWASWWEMTKRTSLTPKNLIVWDKGSSGLGNNYANTYELVGFFARLPKQTAMGNRKTGQRPVHSPNLMRFNRPTGDDRQHNAAKPVDLVQKMIELSTDVGGLVVDWFAGSGSTLIACERANRRCRLTEIDPRYCDVTVRRWQEYTGKSAKGWRGNG